MDICATKQPDGQWTAFDADTYDVDCDDVGFFSTCAVGYGETREAAIGDLIDQIIEKLRDENDADRRHLSDLSDLQKRSEDPGAANAGGLQEVPNADERGAEQAPDREPVGMALASIVRALDDVAGMAREPSTYKEVAAEEIALGQILSRTQLILSFIDSHNEAPKIRAVK
jgi:hypothetical protein